MPSFEDILHPVTIAQVMIGYAATRGVDQDTCLQGTGINLNDLVDGEALITRGQEMRLIENLMLALPDDPALGIRLGLQYNLATFGIWGFALRTSRTLREAVALAVRYLPLSTAYCRIITIDDARHFGIGMDAEPVPIHLRQFLRDRDMATGVNLLKELSLSNIQLAGLEFRGPNTHGAVVAELCSFQADYNSHRDAILVRSEDADRPLPTYDPHLVRMLDDQCRQRLQRLHDDGVSGQVRQQLLGPLGLIASLDEVAQAVAMSPRSLRRKLDQEGTSFRALVEDERRGLALQMLGGSQMKLDELAIHLGYNDTASFTRAFRRWMGCSPGEYRQNQARPS